ncbi:MAG: class I SAM-dependent methyltransferase, partial [Candidatus Omnitrophica bacterium]|nr:class I SAM-dependent methyltransferase [Candidatus Omnitrophota bacterium]
MEITEVSRKHFLDEGERIKAEDREAVYEARDPKELAMQLDFGYIRYDTIFKLTDKYCLDKSGRHLDLGCGLGYVMAKLAQKGLRTSGVDISKSFIEIAREKLKHLGLKYEHLLEADLQKKIGLPDAGFDFITSTDVLEHIEKPEFFFVQIRRLLKAGGRAIICTNNICSIWGIEKVAKELFFQDKGFHPIDRWATIPALKKMAHRFGFKVLEIRGAYFFPFLRMQALLSVFGIYKKRYEINERLSRSFFKY